MCAADDSDHRLLRPSFVCTDDSRPALMLEVRDRASSEYIPVVAQGVAREGEYEDSLALAQWNPGDPIVPISYAAALERPGTYTVHIETAGYQAWDTAGIRVTQEECHGLTVRLNAALDPAPVIARAPFGGVYPERKRRAQGRLRVRSNPAAADLRDRHAGLVARSR